jgi:hypothetical protein
MMEEFYIDTQYLRSITVTKKGNSILDKKGELTAQDTADLLAGKGDWSSTSTNDHPEFAALRNKLSDLGYINRLDNSWNGDTVRKPFKLNNKQFKKGDRFLSATPMKYYLLRSTSTRA